MTNPSNEMKEDNSRIVDSPQQQEVPCDRCGQPMFRMRAVYWCEHCGYKTDCCGH